MKKIFIILGLLSVFSFADVLDSIQEKKTFTFSFKAKDYPQDTECDELENKKFVIISDDALHNRKSKKFYLDTCVAFKNLYQLNKEYYSNLYVYDLHYKTKKHPSNIKKRYYSETYADLMSYYNKSYYVQFYAFLFYKHRNKNMININFSVFKSREDDFSRYVKIYHNTRRIPEYNLPAENYYKKLYAEGLDLLKSKHDIIYQNVAKDIKVYYKNFDKPNYMSFVYKLIEENKIRKLTNVELYLELANIYFEDGYMSEEKNFKEESDVKNFLYLSHKDGVRKSQEELFIKLKARKFYFELISSYPKYITNIEENDLIKSALKKIKKFQTFIKGKYYWIEKSKMFLYEHLIYIRKGGGNMERFRTSLRNVYKMEPNLKDKRRYKEKLTDIKNNLFFSKKFND